MRRNLKSLMLSLITLLGAVSLPSTAAGQQPQRFIADTGLIIPGPHQKLRLTVTATGKTAVTIRFRQMQYMQDSCTASGLCEFSVASQTTSAPITLDPGQAAPLELVATTYGRGNVLSNSPDARVTLQIVDTATGQTQSILIALLLP